LLQEHFVDNIRKLQSWKFKVDSEGKGQREEERGGSEYPEEKKQKKRSDNKSSKYKSQCDYYERKFSTHGFLRYLDLTLLYLQQ
jgi:hypothetical protein